MTVINGIDVSAAGQGASFNWEAWRGRIQFAAVKISESTDYADPDAARNIEGARSIGCQVIGYHFIRAREAGMAQAAWFLAHCAAAGMRPGDILALDAEQEGMDGLTPSQLWTTSAGFAAAVHDHYGGTLWPLAYTDISLAGVAPAVMAGCPLWLANPDAEQLPAIGPWKHIAVEQVSQRGTDADVFYGTPAELAALGTPGHKAVPVPPPAAPPAPAPVVTQARALIITAQTALDALGKLLG